jgi:hypothetical protein
MSIQFTLTAEVANGVTTLFVLKEINNIYVCLHHHNLDPIPGAH